MLLLREVLHIPVRNVSPRGPMCIRCLIFSMPRPCLLFFIASWTREVVSCILVCFVLLCQCICLFCETIRNMFVCVCYFVVECDGSKWGWRCSIG